MLQRLHIQNYAIIDELEISIGQHLNIVTGETGAGKSIIIGALGLILGQRADTSVLRNNEMKCIVEGVFEFKKTQKELLFFKENDLDLTEDIVIRREISANGKSRAFINDTPVNLTQLNQLSSLMVDLHQQFDNLQLKESHFQREVMDALAGNEERIRKYQQVFQQWGKAKIEYDYLLNQKLQFNKELDYNQFLFNELYELGLKENELEELDAELKLLNNSEGIKKALSSASFILQEAESPVTQQIKSLINELKQFAEMHPDMPGLLERMQSVHIELQDIAYDTSKLNDHIIHDSERIKYIEERLSDGYKLFKKHAVNSSHELLAIQDELDKKLQAVLNIEEAINQKKKELEELFKNANELASEIEENRKKQITPFEKKVNQLLSQVGMPNASIKVAIERTVLNEYGFNQIDILFDANKTNNYMPVGKVASGGELSRLMLCIKSLVAKSIAMPTMIFDEIDTGISGEAAVQVGNIMKDLASRHQLICITHQPQIAGRGDAHYYVYKEIVKGAIKTNIRLLSTEERITIIAKMLSGEKPTAAALENAREMLMN